MLECDRCRCSVGNVGGWYFISFHRSAPLYKGANPKATPGKAIIDKRHANMIVDETSFLRRVERRCLVGGRLHADVSSEGEQDT